MSSLEKIVYDLNNLSDEEKQKLNKKLSAKSCNFGVDPVECIKECVIEINSLQFEEEKRKRIESLINEINDRNAKKFELLADSSYFMWLASACKENERMCSDLNEYKTDLSDEDKNKIESISIFYDAISEYANANNIGYYVGDDLTDAYYHVKSGYTIITFSIFRFGGGIVCHISEGFELRMDDEEAINLDDIIAYYNKMKSLNGSQRVMHKIGKQKEEC